MKDYVARMIDELKELNGKIAKLNEAVDNDSFMEEIGREKASLLECQLAAMNSYGTVLSNRILIELEEGNCTLEDLPQ